MLTTKSQTLLIERLRVCLAEARERIAEMETRYEADCYSCVYDAERYNKRKCGTCATRAKLRYTPVAFNDEEISEAESDETGTPEGGGGI
jgi:hypothetical protein